MRHLGKHDETTAGDALLTTGEMARRSTNTLRTVRFYEEEGILRPARRTDGGHRLFDKAELERLMLVSDLRAAGLSLEQIKDVLAAKTGGADHATALLSERMADLRERLTTLQRLEADLSATKDAIGKSDAMLQEHAPRALRVLWGDSALAK